MGMAKTSMARIAPERRVAFGDHIGVPLKHERLACPHAIVGDDVGAAGRRLFHHRLKPDGAATLGHPRRRRRLAFARLRFPDAGNLRQLLHAANEQFIINAAKNLFFQW